jgi:hypothetical protein
VPARGVKNIGRTSCLERAGEQDVVNASGCRHRGRLTASDEDATIAATNRVTQIADK